MDEIRDICFNILVTTAGVSRVILADKTGLTLVHISRFDFDLRDVESMGAISSAVYLASEQQGFNVGLEEMTTLVAEFQSGKILVASCGNAVLCLITDNDVALGMARMTINQAAKQIEELLDMLIEQDWSETEYELDEPVAADVAPAVEEDAEETEFLSDLQNALRELENF
ncbi:MAG: roadblock/LC7 domain-containing protein [Candidatus Heimdallarchaeota archaeon]|nr:roadblock/LC7 domain-containing protein [Candidatus Heimdallarchaeota archaeon]